MTSNPMMSLARPPVLVFVMNRSPVYGCGDVILRQALNGFVMTDEGKKRAVETGAPADRSSKAAKQARRQDRLKQSLRDNLKRRKSQARGRDDLIAVPSNVDAAAPSHDGGKTSDP